MLNKGSFEGINREDEACSLSPMQIVGSISSLPDAYKSPLCRVMIKNPPGGHSPSTGSTGNVKTSLMHCRKISHTKECPGE